MVVYVNNVDYLLNEIALSAFKRIAAARGLDVPDTGTQREWVINLGTLPPA